jgi:hypothetical protein
MEYKITVGLYPDFGMKKNAPLRHRANAGDKKKGSPKAPQSVTSGRFRS